MRTLLAFVVLALATVAGCATDATVRATASELSGTYYSGDGLGRMVWVQLHPDGTYTSEWEGCLGLYGNSEGFWDVQDDRIHFDPLEESESLVGYLREATTLRHDGKFGFARTEDVAGDRVRESLLFLKQDPRR